MNYRKVLKHNEEHAKGKQTYKLDLNHLADMVGNLNSILLRYIKMRQIYIKTWNWQFRTVVDVYLGGGSLNY